MLAPILYLAVIVLAFFLLIVRPQRRQMAAHRALVASLEVGDEVIMSSGLYGSIRAIAEETLQVEIASGVVVKIARAAVSRRAVPPAGH